MATQVKHMPRLGLSCQQNTIKLLQADLVTWGPMTDSHIPRGGWEGQVKVERQEREAPPELQLK